MPTEAEIAALLALPDGAREALKGCAGPGWHVHFLGVELLAGPPPPGGNGAWLPCNPLEIVRVVASRAGNVEHWSAWSPLPGFHGGGCECDGPVEFKIRHTARVNCRMREWDTEARGETAHLAALALLGEVWG